MTEATQDIALEQGSYDLIKRRLDNFGGTLKGHIDTLNSERIEAFGNTDIKVEGRARVRTEHNCIPRDIVVVGDKLIFAYNVFMGLKKNVDVSDVFTVQKLTVQDDHFDVEPYPEKTPFLTNERFARDFEELYTYYKNARLQHLFRHHDNVYALFQIGERLSDIRIFRWEVTSENTLNYIDNRGDLSHIAHENYDFEWIKTDRKDHVEGKHPHINIADTLFVETVNGDLTIKIENNTEDGQGIYQEPVEDKSQSLADCGVEYALVGDLVLVKMLPYREKAWRYFIYNTRTQNIQRQDAINDACVSLPEDHGIIFPGGYSLQSGETRYFEEQIDNLTFHRQIKSPNGEDVLYVFYEPNEGRYALFAYNMIEKSLQNPIYCHGYGIFDDGQTLTFKAENDAPERVHPIQVWRSPFTSAQYAADAPAPTSYLGKIGNPDLVRGISDFYSVYKAIKSQSISRNHYEDLIGLARAIFDRYHWLNESQFTELTQTLHQVQETTEHVLDEFEKITQIQEKAKVALLEIQAEYTEITTNIRPQSYKTTSEFVSGLTMLKRLKGKLLSLEEIKYIDLSALEQLSEQTEEYESNLSNATAQFLQSDEALIPYHERITQIEQESNDSESVVDLQAFITQLEALGEELDLLNHTMLDLEIDDSRVRTQILEDVSGVYALVNRAKAAIDIRKKQFGSVEAKAEFGARFKLFSQSITNALNNAKTPEQCDDQLSRLLIQLEELESQFSEHDDYLAEIIEKRDDVYESFEAHKQALIDAQQRRALTLASAAERILQGVTRRSAGFNDVDALNTYFVSDPMIGKLHNLVKELQTLGDDIKADDIGAKLKACKDQGVRALRDKKDIYSDGGNLVAIGKHQFTVNKQSLDLTLLPRDNELMLHLSGTDYFEQIPDASDRQALNDAQDLWEQNLISENEIIYRGEFLAASMIKACKESDHPLTKEALFEAQATGTLEKLVQKFAEPRYQEGYEKGIHDHDATRILDKLLTQEQNQGLLAYPMTARIVAMHFLSNLAPDTRNTLHNQAINAALMETHFGELHYTQSLNTSITEQITTHIAQLTHPIFNDFKAFSLCSEYIIAEFATQTPSNTVHVSINIEAKNLAENFISHAKVNGFHNQLESAQQALLCQLEQLNLLHNWLNAYSHKHEIASKYALEAAAYILFQHAGMQFKAIEQNSDPLISNLMGQHSLINNQTLEVDYAELVTRTDHYITHHAPRYERYHKMRANILEAQKERLQLDEFRAKPLSSFVRNQLINNVYFPIIGDNLAKQIGAAGNAKRTDLMGMLLLISPPGYGKTTLIEYVANKLGLTFVKVNCPSIGHDQVSLDPSSAINATAEKEINKINQSFEMGNNVMLYLDDIQHTNPEFLQKFISLCDGSRRIDGVWEGKSKTYDLRGKKFSVVMAGNPYTESGEAFKIPDMLANRADIYNLGDTLSGCKREFAMSFIENSLTSNATLAPLANRNIEDLYLFIRSAEGETIPLNEYEYGYSQAEASEITAVLSRLITIRNTVLKVNAQYIASAAQDNKYRVEPPFKLQGSYRNMNKMAEKVVAAMNDEELENLIQDHYRGEAQTLSQGSEENLLKLGELRETLTEQETARWTQIKDDYVKANRIDGAGSPAMLAVNQIALVHDALQTISEKLTKANLSHNYTADISSLNTTLSSLSSEEALSQLGHVLKTAMNTSLAVPLAAHNECVQQHNETQKDSLNQISEAIKANNSNHAISVLTDTLNETLSTSEINHSLEHLTKQLATNHEMHTDVGTRQHNELISTLNETLKDTSSKNAIEQLCKVIATHHTESTTDSTLNEIGNTLKALDTKAQLSELIETIKASNVNQNIAQLTNALVEQASHNTQNNQVLFDVLSNIEKSLTTCDPRESIDNIAEAINASNNHNNITEQLTKLNDVVATLPEYLTQLHDDNMEQRTAMSHSKPPSVTIENTPDPVLAQAVNTIAETIDASLMPVLKIMQHKIRLDHDVWNKVDALSKQLKLITPNFDEPDTQLSKEDELILEKSD